MGAGADDEWFFNLTRTLYPISREVRRAIHNYTLRLDFSFTQITNEFSVKDDSHYFQGIAMYVALSGACCVACFIIIIVFYIYFGRTSTSTFPKCMLLLKVLLIVVTLTIGALTSLCLLGYLSTHYSFFRVKARYSNVAITALRDVNRLLYDLSLLVFEVQAEMIKLKEYRLLNGIVSGINTQFVSFFVNVDFVRDLLSEIVRIIYLVWNLQFLAMIVGAVLICVCGFLNLLIVVAVVFRSARLMKFLCGSSTLMLLIWWLIAAMLIPMVLVLSDTCYNPIDSIAQIVGEKNKYVTKEMVIYFLSCKGRNPLEPPLKILRGAMTVIAKTMQTLVASIKGMAWLLGMSTLEERVGNLSKRMGVVEKARDQLHIDCRWTKTAFDHAAGELCAGILLGLLLTWFCAFMNGLLSTLLIMLNIRAGRYIALKGQPCIEGCPRAKTNLKRSDRRRLKRMQKQADKIAKKDSKEGIRVKKTMQNKKEKVAKKDSKEGIKVQKISKKRSKEEIVAEKPKKVAKKPSCEELKSGKAAAKKQVCDINKGEKKAKKRKLEGGNVVAKSSKKQRYISSDVSTQANLKRKKPKVGPAGESPPYVQERTPKKKKGPTLNVARTSKAYSFKYDCNIDMNVVKNFNSIKNKAKAR